MSDDYFKLKAQKDRLVAEANARNEKRNAALMEQLEGTLMGKLRKTEAERDALASTVTGQRSEIDTLRAELELLRPAYDRAIAANDRWRRRVDAFSDEAAAARAEWPSFIREYTAWAVETFPEGTAESGSKHLKKEIDELLASGEPEELADCFMLLLFVASKKGLDGTRLLLAARAKFAINRARTWGKPNADGFREHVK